MRLILICAMPCTEPLKDLKQSAKYRMMQDDPNLLVYLNRDNCLLENVCASKVATMRGFEPDPC